MSSDAELLERIPSLQAENPGNIGLNAFEQSYYDTLPADEKADFLRCVRSGIDNPDSAMGCYAMQPADYDRFKPFFAKALAKYHGVAETATHVTDWSLDSVEGLPESGVLSLSELGLRKSLSMRVRVGRNLEQWPLPGAMSKEQRCDMENFMLAAFDSLISMSEFGGKYCSFTPGHANFVDETEYQALVKAHIAFKDMSADKYLVSAGIAGDWPHGRGVYISDDKGFIIWVGEEDHLRIMCMKKGTVLNQVFDRLQTALSVVEGIDGISFASSPDFGMVTSCPTNLGTGMRASVLMRLPHLTATDDGGTSDSAVKDIATPLGLSVRGLGGEHTPIGADGTVDLSPSARFCVTEAQIISSLYNGIKELKRREDEAREMKGDSERDKQEAALEAQRAEGRGKFGSWMAKKVPISQKWKHRNFSARVFGIMVGVVIPFLIATPGLQMLAAPGYFRGTAPSARLLIGRLLAYNSTDLSLLYGPPFMPNSTISEGAQAAIASMTEDDHADLRTYMESRMADACWNANSWLGKCQVRDGQPAEGPLSLAYGWPAFIDPEDLYAYEAKVALNETAVIPAQDGIFRMHAKNNPWAVIIGCIMFSCLYQLWLNVFLNGALDASLQRIATAMEDATDSIIDAAPFVTAKRMDEASKHRKAQRVSLVVGWIVSLLLGALSVLFLMMAIEGNQFGIKVMSDGDVVVATSKEMRGADGEAIVDDEGGCEWVANNDNDWDQELAGFAETPAQCIELVQKMFPNATLASLPLYGEGNCYAQFPERWCNSCRWANDGM